MTDQPEAKQLQPQHSTEAPCSANVRARIGGYDWQITCRSHVDQDDLRNMAKAIKWWNAWLDDIGAPPSKAAADAINIELPTPTMSATVTTPAPTQADINGGTFHISKMTVTPRADGKVELAFFEAGHNYADIKAIKSAADCAVLLQPIGAWLPTHFAAVGEYPVNCLIDWKPSANLNKNGKPYKNIAAVKPANA